MFSPDSVARLYPSGEAPEFITHVDAAGKNVTQVGDLASFRQLLRLNLENNELAEFGGLAESTTLKQLLLANNRITKVPSLHIPELQVGALLLAAGRHEWADARHDSVQMIMQLKR